MPDPHPLGPRLAACLALLFTGSAPAQLPVPRLTSLFPPGAQTGTSQPIRIHGSDLDDPRTLVFSDPRITVSPDPTLPESFRVTIPDGLPPGLVEARFVGRFGVSNPRLFAIGLQPEQSVSSLPISPDTALPLEPGVTLNARVLPQQAHWLRFSARHGQRSVFRIHTRDLDSRLVPDLAVTDANRRELAVARRTSSLDFTAPADGPFWLRVNDQTYRGGDDYSFRLTLEPGPVIEFLVPPILHANATNEITVFGRNLPHSTPSSVSGSDGRPLDQLTLFVAAPPQVASPGLPSVLPRRPPASTLGVSWFQTSLPLGDRSAFALAALTSSPIPIRNLLPSPPSTTTDRPTNFVHVQPPVLCTGLFPAIGHSAGITFDAQKGDVLWLELASDRLGYPADPRLVVQRIQPHQPTHNDPEPTTRALDLLELNDSDPNPGGRDFDLSSRDPAGRLAIPETGTYRVLVQNLFQSGRNAGRVPFWLELRPESPDFQLTAWPQPPPRLNDADRQVHLWSTSLRRGETRPFRVAVTRRDGFDGEIEIAASPLPAGLTSTPARIPPGQNATSLLLTAASDTPDLAFPFEIHGTARMADRIITRRATPGTTVWHVPDWDQERAQSRPASQLWISTCAAESAPIRITPISNQPVQVTNGTRVSLAWQIHRSPTFTSSFTLKPGGHPELEKLKELTLPDHATNATLELNLAELKLPAGEHLLWLHGLATGKYRNNPEALALAETDLKAATDAATTAVGDQKPAATERLEAAEARKKAAEERAKPRDLTTAVYSQPLRLRLLPPPADAQK